MHTKALSNYLIRKASGDQVYFDGQKLINSLVNSGSSVDLAEQILKAIGLELHDGMLTRDIYNKAYQILQKQEKKIALNYRLKQAVLQLGPSGYPFEHFVSKLFKARGFNVNVGQLVNGYSVKHEIDVMAKNDHKHIFVECKFHNYQGTKTNVKVPMYIRSRFDDLSRVRQYSNELKDMNTEGWIITNTRFTEDAIKFGRDYGLTLLSWDYPKKGNLKDWIELENLHPITCLSSITRKEKKWLLGKNIVMCNDLHQHILNDDNLAIKPRNLRAVKRELRSFVD